jgi:hypothetical protein
MNYYSTEAGPQKITGLVHAVGNIEGGKRTATIQLGIAMKSSTHRAPIQTRKMIAKLKHMRHSAGDPGAKVTIRDTEDPIAKVTIRDTEDHMAKVTIRDTMDHMATAGTIMDDTMDHMATAGTGGVPTISPSGMTLTTVGDVLADRSRIPARLTSGPLDVAEWVVA